MTWIMPSVVGVAVALANNGSRVERVAGVVLAIAGGTVAVRVLSRAADGSVTLLMATAVAAGCAAIPVVVATQVRAIRANHALGRATAEEFGATQVLGLNTASFDAVAAAVPNHATYYIESRPNFRLWAMNRLLPRISVAKPAEADYVVWEHRRPSRDLGVKLAAVREVAPMVWVAEVRR